MMLKKYWKLAAFLVTGSIPLQLFAQRIPQVPDSIRKQYKVRYQQEVSAVKQEQQKLEDSNVPAIDFTKYTNDTLLKKKLVQLALDNSELRVADANIEIAKAQFKYAKSSWLSSISAGANVNEFVINNSAAASFFPKYNVGLALPFDIASRTKKEKKVARENIEINQELKKQKMASIEKETLVRYENYKEQHEILMLQQASLEYDLTANEAAKKSYADGEIKLEDMNKAYQVVLSEKANLISKKRNYNVAKLELEEIIGVKIID
ncbi:MAG: hypothetical protein ABS68_14410 [Niastella sp. SCN 39-18]|mgnify:FL=1|nr:TolC family protein [Sphingobacteriales bacterium]ODT48535.1 MAG: hypothetical protein ABS68_14410 [Niastella sp. SCN 39-18]OJW07509.1 MAG: hypothetical protein BGO53_03075 [Sphingobacteriales bacterium 39-19]